jgi:hypothetical protein
MRSSIQSIFGIQYTNNSHVITIPFKVACCIEAEIREMKPYKETPFFLHLRKTKNLSK